jgi:hypothetical protein
MSSSQFTARDFGKGEFCDSRHRRVFLLVFSFSPKFQNEIWLCHYVTMVDFNTEHTCGLLLANQGFIRAYCKCQSSDVTRYHSYK